MSLSLLSLSFFSFFISFLSLLSFPFLLSLLLFSLSKINGCVVCNLINAYFSYKNKNKKITLFVFFYFRKKKPKTNEKKNKLFVFSVGFPNLGLQWLLDFVRNKFGFFCIVVRQGNKGITLEYVCCCLLKCNHFLFMCFLVYFLFCLFVCFNFLLCLSLASFCLSFFSFFSLFWFVFLLFCDFSFKLHFCDSNSSSILTIPPVVCSGMSVHIFCMSFAVCVCVCWLYGVAQIRNLHIKNKKKQAKKNVLNLQHMVKGRIQFPNFSKCRLKLQHCSLLFLCQSNCILSSLQALHCLMHVFQSLQCLFFFCFSQLITCCFR